MKKVRTVLGLILASGFFGLFSLSAKAQENVVEVLVTEMNQVMTVVSDCEARELPDEDSASVMSYTAGSSAWVIGETQDGWYKVSYQGKQGFLPKDVITELQVEVAGEIVSAATGDKAMISSQEDDVEDETAFEEQEEKTTEDSITVDKEADLLQDDESEKQENQTLDEEEKKTVSLKDAGLDKEMEAMEAENKLLVEEIERVREEEKRSRFWTVVIALLVIGIFATGIISTVKGSKDKKKDDGKED